SRAHDGRAAGRSAVPAALLKWRAPRRSPRDRPACPGSSPPHSGHARPGPRRLERYDSCRRYGRGRGHAPTLAAAAAQRAHRRQASRAARLGQSAPPGLRRRNPRPRSPAAALRPRGSAGRPGLRARRGSQPARRRPYLREPAGPRSPGRDGRPNPHQPSHLGGQRTGAAAQHAKCRPERRIRRSRSRSAGGRRPLRLSDPQCAHRPRRRFKLTKAILTAFRRTGFWGFHRFEGPSQEDSGAIMAQIEGLAAHAAGAELLPYRYDPGELGVSEVEISISHCGVSHSDLHLIANDWGISQYPFIPGHEIIGTVAALGAEVRNFEIGQRVGLGWQSNSCGVCEWCTAGEENLCALSEGTCVHRSGGYADRVRANSRFVVPIPEALASEQAAPLLCGGITVYHPLRIHGVNPSSRVGVAGIGGLGHLAIQFARAFGAEVFAFSTSVAKEEDARAFGAHHFINSRETKAMKEVAGALDLLLTTVNADQDWSAFLATLRPRGTL